jgi:hypothetical protein
MELHTAFTRGRMGADPIQFWYDGELKFFDNYIIPLAKKLKDCNVFGAFSDDYLNYAVMNRAEWEDKGQSIVQEYQQFIDAAAALAEQQEEMKKKQKQTSKHDRDYHDHSHDDPLRTASAHGQRSTASTAIMSACGSSDTDRSSSQGAEQSELPIDSGNHNNTNSSSSHHPRRRFSLH